MLLEIALFAICIVRGESISKNPHITAAKLGSLAHTSSLHAQNLASYQQIAASHANFSVKNDLAQSASIASSTARAAVVTKRLEVQAIKNRLQQAEKVLEEEVEQYEQLKLVAETLLKVTEESQSQSDTIREILERVKNQSCKDAKIVKSDEDISFGSGFH